MKKTKIKYKSRVELAKLESLGKTCNNCKFFPCMPSTIKQPLPLCYLFIDLEEERKRKEMREIKFRAWDTRINEYSSVLYYPFKWEDYKAVPNVDYDGEIVFQQYTGLKDKNGKEIYESDILSNYYFGEERALVIYHNGCFKAEPNCFNGGSSFTKYDQFDKEEMTDILSKYIVKWKGSEVIGNIYENPELLEANK